MDCGFEAFAFPSASVMAGAPHTTRPRLASARRAIQELSDGVKAALNAKQGKHFDASLVGQRIITSRARRDHAEQESRPGRPERMKVKTDQSTIYFI